MGLAAYIAWGLLTVYWKALHRFDAFELISHRVVWSSLLLALALSRAQEHRFDDSPRLEPQM